jgi:hypothetical protein
VVHQPLLLPPDRRQEEAVASQQYAHGHKQVFIMIWIPLIFFVLLSMVIFAYLLF